MPPKSYSSYKGKGSSRRKGGSDYVALLPALSEYEKTLANYPGPAKNDSWIVDFLRSAPIPGANLLLQSPLGEAIVGKAERPIKNVLEAGEDAPVIGPAIGALGRGFDILSRGNYAAANVARELQGEPTEDTDQSILEQLKNLWQVGAAIPGMALPDFVAENLGLRREDVSAGELGRAAWQGLSGKEKTTFGKVLGEQGVENNFLQGVGGLGLDVALDPTTYVGTGVVKGLPKADEILDLLKRGGGPDTLMNSPVRSLVDNAVPTRPVVGETPVDIRTRTNPFPGMEPPAPSGATQWSDILGPKLPEGQLPPPVSPLSQVVGDFSPYPRPSAPREFIPQNPLGPTTSNVPLSPVEEVGSSGITDQFLQGELPFDRASRLEIDPIQGKQLNLFDRRTRAGKKALEGMEWPRVRKPGKYVGPAPATRPIMSETEAISEAIDEAARMVDASTPMGQLALQFPEKAEEIKWLRLFDPESPPYVKKNWSPSVGVELRVDPPEPWEIESLISMPARAASDDWEVARQLYLPDGPVDIPVSQLASDSTGLIKAPYEIPGVKGENFKLILPRHREMMNLSDDGAKLAEPNILDVGDVNKPWGKPGSGGGGPKGPRFNPGKLPGAGSAASKAEGYVALRFAGVDIIRNQAAYKVGRSIFRPFFYGNGIARTLGKAFNLGAHLPDGLDQMYRVSENKQMAYFDRSMRAVTGHLGKLPLEERRQIGRALADGTNLNEIKASVVSDGFSTAEDYRQLARGIFDEVWTAEQGQNIAKGPYVENYFRRQILNEGKLSKDEIRYAKAKNADGSYKHSVQDLIDKGIEIELDVNKILVDRAAEAARKLTRADFQWQAVARFGVPAKDVSPEMAKKLDMVPMDASITGKEFQGKIMVPRHVNEAMNWLGKQLDSDQESMKLMTMLDRVIGEWKYLALATPGRHVRDTIGDVIMNAQAGVWNPWSYRKASKVLGWKAGNNVRAMDEAYVISKAFGKPVSPNIGQVTIAGQKVPIEKVWDQLYIQSGAKAGQLSTEVSRLAVAPKGRGQVRGGAINVPGRTYAAAKRFIGRGSDIREDWSRLAHVIDYVERKADRRREIFGPNYDLTSYGKQLVDEAGKSVRKWNIDYGNLTPFERNTVRRIIPFWTFMRHNIPRQLELLFTKPGFMALYPKGNNLMQGVFGTESGDDTLLPDWIRESAPFRVQLEKQEQKGALGWLLKQFGAAPGQQVLADPHAFTTPIGDFTMLNALADREDPLRAVTKEVGSRLSPAFKIPMEVIFGEKIFNEAPVKGNYLGYLMEQLPQSRAANNAIFEGRPGAREGIARMLTGIPIRGVTDQMMNNEAFRREQEARQLFRESLSRNLPPQYRIPRTGNPQLDEKAEQREREIYRNLMRSQQGG